MPCVTLHCLVHLITPEHQAQHYPAIYKIITSDPTSPEHYSLWDMMFWASWPYAMWQLSYHIFITVRRAEKIAAGRPTSFTWLRKSFKNTWIGKFVLSLPDSMQETAYMLIQYTYALLTMIPCPIWFWYRWASASFLMVVFGWSVWNGATFYIDVFGMRFAKELENLRKDVAKWQNTPDLNGRFGFISPLTSPQDESSNPTVQQIEPNSFSMLQKSSVGAAGDMGEMKNTSLEGSSIETIPRLHATSAVTGAAIAQDGSGLAQRKVA
jgi:hypothetical protein